MAKVRQDAWSHEDDLLLAETVLRHIRQGSTQLNAFEEVGDKSNHWKNKWKRSKKIIKPSCKLWIAPVKWSFLRMMKIRNYQHSSWTKTVISNKLHAKEKNHQQKTHSPTLK